MAEKKVELRGCMNWKQLRAFMILRLLDCTDEAKFQDFLTNLALSLGTDKELKERRKILGIKDD